MKLSKIQQEVLAIMRQAPHLEYTADSLGHHGTTTLEALRRQGLLTRRATSPQAYYDPRHEYYYKLKETSNGDQ